MTITATAAREAFNRLRQGEWRIDDECEIDYSTLSAFIDQSAAVVAERDAANKRVEEVPKISFDHQSTLRSERDAAIKERDEAREALNKAAVSKKLPPLPEELYEYYPAMSAQSHAVAVQAYARSCLRRAAGQGGEHG